MINIFSYTNYRTFLQDVYLEKKEKGTSFSYRSFSKFVGFSSPNYMRMVIKGDRNLSQEAILKLIKYLKLNKTQASFFKSLINFNQSTEPEDKKKHFEKICYFKGFQEIKKIDHKNYCYFSKWYYPAIREMTLLDNFREDPRWIADQLHPNITPEEAKEALCLLVEIGFLAKGKDNRLKIIDKNIKTDSEVINISLWNFHQQMIGQAKHALDHTDAEFRDILSVTVALNQAKFKKFRKKLNDLCEEISVECSHGRNADSVYQVNLQLFNLTKTPKSWR